jgi:hypothetical protein
MDQEIELKTENQNPKTDEIYRIAVTKEAEKALHEMMEKVNRGFEGGKINKMEMASWALIRLHSEMNEATVQDVRSEHFDEVAALEAVLRRAKEQGRVSQELRLMLLKQGGFDGVSKKAPKQNKIDK